MKADQINVSRFCDVLKKFDYEITFLDEKSFELHGKKVTCKTGRVKSGQRTIEFYSFHSFLLALRKFKIWDATRKKDTAIEKEYSEQKTFKQFFETCQKFKWIVPYKFDKIIPVDLEIFVRALTKYLVIDNEGPLILYVDETKILIKQYTLEIIGTKVFIENKPYQTMKSLDDIGGVIEAIIQSHILEECGRNLDNYVPHFIRGVPTDKYRDDNFFVFNYRQMLWKKLNPGKKEPEMIQVPD